MELLTVTDVAGILGVSRSTVYRLVSDGALRSVRVTTRTVRFCPEDVEAFIHAGGRGGRRILLEPPPAGPGGARRLSVVK